MVRTPNVIFIIVDALRSKNLGCYGYERPTSPHIDKLACEGVLFDNAFCCVNTTDPSLTTIFSGKYPISHGITQHAEKVRVEDIQRFYESGIPLLPEILKTRKFRTLAIDWLGRWHRRGYDYYSGILELHKFKPHTLFLNMFLGQLPTVQQATLHRIARPLFSIGERKNIDNAKVMTDKAISLIKQASRFFLFIHYWDVHAPYSAPFPYYEKFAKHNYECNLTVKELLDKFDSVHCAHMNRRIPKDITSVREVLALYDASIAFVDHEIGRLMDFLEKIGILDETIIVLTADHGESLVEHGIYFEHHGLYDVTIKVPLIIRYPPLGKSRKIRELVQHVDLVPTLLDLLGVEVSAFDFDGRSLLPTIEDGVKVRSAVYVEEFRDERKRAIRTDDYKFISAFSEKDAVCRLCGYVHGGTKELYDMNKDCDENHNIIKEKPKVGVKLETELTELIRTLKDREEKRRKGRAVAHDIFKDEEVVKERLKSLGYF